MTTRERCSHWRDLRNWKKVTLYQGVTLGAKRFDRDEAGTVIKGKARHPIIEDSVTIYSGATILGRVRVGKGSIIGGNVWLTEDVPEFSKISQQRSPQAEKMKNSSKIEWS